MKHFYFIQIDDVLEIPTDNGIRVGYRCCCYVLRIAEVFLSQNGCLQICFGELVYLGIQFYGHRVQRFEGAKKLANMRRSGMQLK